MNQALDPESNIVTAVSESIHLSVGYRLKAVIRDGVLCYLSFLFLTAGVVFTPRHQCFAKNGIIHFGVSQNDGL